MIIGLTGGNCSGKGEIAKYLNRKGFQVLSLSDCLREEANKRNLPHSREILTGLGNELRRKYGSGILAKRVIKKMNRENAEGIVDIVIDSIRNPEEINELRKLKNFFLLGVKASLRIRFLRSTKRSRTGDMRTLYKFKKQEAEENRNKKTNQQLKRCIILADRVILNNSTISNLHKKIDKGLSQFFHKKKWDCP